MRTRRLLIGMLFLLAACAPLQPALPAGEALVVSPAVPAEGVTAQIASLQAAVSLPDAPPTAQTATPESPPETVLPVSSTFTPEPPPLQPSQAPLPTHTAQATPTEVRAYLPDQGAAPELENETWLNTEQPLHLADLRGRVVILDMWTFN